MRPAGTDRAQSAQPGPPQPPPISPTPGGSLQASLRGTTGCRAAACRVDVPGWPARAPRVGCVVCGLRASLPPHGGGWFAPGGTLPGAVFSSTMSAASGCVCTPPGVVCVTRTGCGVPCAVRARHWWVRSPRLVTMMRAAGPRTPCLPGAASCPRDGAVRHPTHVTSQRTHPGTTQHTDAPCNGSSTPRNTPPTPRTRRAPNGGELLLCGLPPRAGPGGAGYRRAPLAAARETT